MLEEHAPRGKDLLALARAAFAHPQQLQQPRLHPAAVGVVGHQFLEGDCDALARRPVVVPLSEAGALAHHLAQRPETDAFAVRRRAADMPVHVLRQTVGVLLELADQAALTRSGLADDAHQPRTTLARRGVKELLDQAQLVVASFERRLEPGMAAGATHAGTGSDLPFSC
jgi:hypothetical protein